MYIPLYTCRYHQMGKDVHDELMGNQAKSVSKVNEYHGHWKAIGACMTDESRYSKNVFHGAIHS